MITVSERAKEELKAILIAIGADLDKGLRLQPTADGFALTLDSKLSGDQVVEFDGFKVLLVGIEYFSIFDEATVDCRDTEDGPVLFVR